MTKPNTETAVEVGTAEILPVTQLTPKDLEAALENYLAVQRVLDAKLPDSIITIRGKKFRKKSYWRAIARGFYVDTELVSEERIEVGDDRGYEVCYRATTPDGRSTTGDGACMGSEKQGDSRTLHNVRAHAHTRAKNRAISDLVGFGEVSAACTAAVVVA